MARRRDDSDASDIDISEPSEESEHSDSDYEDEESTPAPRTRKAQQLQELQAHYNATLRPVNERRSTRTRAPRRVVELEEETPVAQMQRVGFSDRTLSHAELMADIERRLNELVALFALLKATPAEPITPILFGAPRKQ